MGSLRSGRMLGGTPMQPLKGSSAISSPPRLKHFTQRRPAGPSAHSCQSCCTRCVRLRRLTSELLYHRGVASKSGRTAAANLQKLAALSSATSNSCKNDGSAD
eukprot:6176750-Pyramimonas_sp.AAC.1